MVAAPRFRRGKTFGQTVNKKPVAVVIAKKHTTKSHVPRNILTKTRQRVKMKWSKNYNIEQGTVDIPTFQKFRWTSIYDPDESAGFTDHQPWSYDTYSNLYKHYTIIGCTATVTCAQHGPNEAQSTIFLTNSAVASPANLTTYSQFMENPATSGGVVIAPNKPRVFKKSYTKMRVFGNTQNSNLTGLMGGASVGSDTSEQYYLLVAVMNAKPGVPSAPIVFTIDLVYDVLLTENKTLATS